MTRLLATGALLLLAVAPAGAAPVSAAASDLPRVTLIGDSVATGIPGDTVALATLRSGIDLQLELAPCRAVAGTGCLYGGVAPPTVVEIVQQLGPSLGPTVIVEAGYDDFAAGFAGDVGQALQALQQAGVTRVIWLTLRESPQQTQYAGMDDTLRSIAATDPSLTLVDWSSFSQGEDGWFQSDGVHLYGAGARAMADLLHSTLLTLGFGAPPLAVATVAPRERGCTSPTRWRWRPPEEAVPTAGRAARSFPAASTCSPPDA